MSLILQPGYKCVRLSLSHGICHTRKVRGGEGGCGCGFDSRTTFCFCYVNKRLRFYWSSLNRDCFYGDLLYFNLTTSSQHPSLNPTSILRPKQVIHGLLIVKRLEKNCGMEINFFRVLIPCFG